MHLIPFILLGLILVCFFVHEAAAEQNQQAHDDEINDLPGVDFDLNFKHYSGYLQVSSTRFLHYWFVTSQNDPKNDPLVFWFNGGPGCSSLLGLLEEMGPYLVQPGGLSLAKNPHAWNRNASVVFMESPAGVGYSYASDGNVTTGDNLTAQENYKAVKQFFARHTTFRNNSIYIAGESYGGIYVPMLAALFVDGQEDFPVKLEGMAIGNGYVNKNLNDDTWIRFVYYHGFIDEQMWRETIVQKCCNGNVDNCDLSLEGNCRYTMMRISEDINKLYAGVNPYNMYGKCGKSSPSDNNDNFQFNEHVMGSKASGNRLEHRQMMIAAEDEEDTEICLSQADQPCLDSSDTIKYLNLPEVRKALHISENAADHWKMCNQPIYCGYRRIYSDASHFVKKALRANVRVLLYYGDTDMVCNFLMGQQFSARLNLTLLTEKQPWMFDGQLAGFKTLYSNQYTFLTVRGAGHMVPQFRPAQIGYAFNQFLFNQTI